MAYRMIAKFRREPPAREFVRLMAECLGVEARVTDVDVQTPAPCRWDYLTTVELPSVPDGDVCEVSALAWSYSVVAYVEG